jgi:hypothetical protein
VTARRTVAVFALATVLCAALSACAKTPTDSGVRGTVTIGPTSPVQRAGESGEAPYAADITIKTADGSVAARVRSGVSGTFTVDLIPGSYTLVPQNGSPLPIAQPVDVVVRPHAFTDVTIAYDSGIR